MPTEADARIVVDRLLREAGWDIEDKSQVSTEEAAADGRADYVLKNQRSQPPAPIETKRFSVDPYSAKEQAREYAVMRPEHLASRSREAAERFLDYLPSVSCLQEVFFLRRPILLDPDDEVILELAVAAHCRYIITHNIADFRGCGGLASRPARRVSAIA
jgi:hypothetical protein